MSHLAGYAGRKPAHIAILRDMAMLENQIPLFESRKTLEIQFSSSELADDTMCSMLLGFCKRAFSIRDDAGYSQDSYFQRALLLAPSEIINEADDQEDVMHPVIQVTRDLQHLFFSQDQEEIKTEGKNSTTEVNRPPL
ncbi:hypothetical protein OIU78_008372 [Salix suchowensis]|nr:hypothetical protein OIU78_008372 [Salix suchowensis]